MRVDVLGAGAAALVDGVLLLDCGPETPAAAWRHGLDLLGVRHILMSGPPSGCPAPDGVEVLGPGVPTREPLQLGSYEVVALPADDDRLWWDVTGPDGGRLLYAPDAGPEAMAAMTDSTAYDFVLPGDPENRNVVPDTGGAPRAERFTVGGQRVLVLGGARSGKSTYAERLLAAEPAVDYVATSGARPDDPDWVQRVAEHRARRPATWRTLETTDIEGVLATPGPPVLLDCFALWLTAVLDGVGGWDDANWDGGSRDAVRARVESLIAAWRDTPRYVVAVSNEVGSGVVPSYPSGIRFRDELGKLNMRLADVSDRVILLVAGRPLDLTPERTA